MKKIIKIIAIMLFMFIGINEVEATGWGLYKCNVDARIGTSYSIDTRGLGPRDTIKQSVSYDMCVVNGETYIAFNTGTKIAELTVKNSDAVQVNFTGRNATSKANMCPLVLGYDLGLEKIVGATDQYTDHNAGDTRGYDPVVINQVKEPNSTTLNAENLLDEIKKSFSSDFDAIKKKIDQELDNITGISTNAIDRINNINNSDNYCEDISMINYQLQQLLNRTQSIANNVEKFIPIAQQYANDVTYELECTKQTVNSQGELTFEKTDTVNRILPNNGCGDILLNTICSEMQTYQEQLKAELNTETIEKEATDYSNRVTEESKKIDQIAKFIETNQKIITTKCDFINLNRLSNIITIADDLKEEIKKAQNGLAEAYNKLKATNGIVSNDVQTCEELIPEDVRKMIQEVLNVVRIIVPILVIVLGMLDFGKAALSSKEDEMKKSQGKFVKRLLIAVAIFFIPTFLNIMFDIINKLNIITDNCGIK